MSVNRRVWVAGTAALLVLSSLGCSICPLIPDGPTPTPSEPAGPTRTPTRDIGDMAFFTDPLSGISLLYPEGWEHESDGEAVYLAENEGALAEGDPEEGPLFAVMSVAPDDLASYGDVDTPQALIDTVLDFAGGLAAGGCSLSDAESFSFSGTPGARADGPCEDPPVYLLLGAAYSDDVAGVIIAAAPVDDWDEHGPVLEAVFASVEFSPPQAPEGVDMGEIEPRQTVEATLPPDTVHSWYFDAEEDTFVTVELNAADTYELDTYLELYDPHGSLLTSDDDGGGDYNSLIMLYPIRSTGTYEIQVSALSGDGDYSLSLTISTDVPPGGGSVGYSEVVSATLVSGLEHEWTFDGQQGDQVTIAMVDLLGNLDPYLELYGPDDEYLMSDDDGGWYLDSLIEFYELPEAGTYTIVCSGLGDSAGRYELRLDLGPHGLLSEGDTVTDSLQPHDRHSWLFDGSGGDVVTIRLVASDDEFDAYLELFGPDGEQLITDDDSGGGTDSRIEKFELPQSGTYRIVARSYYDDGEGAYELTLSPQ